MSFPRYPLYKDSGVEWLGQVPAHWKVSKLKRVVNPARQITYGIVQAGPHFPEGVPYIRPADMTDEEGVLVPDEVMRTSPEIASGYSRSTIRTGDLVCSIGPSFGKVMITPDWLDGANLTQGTARIAVQQPNKASYLFWTLRSTISVAQWESSVGGATFRALNLGPLAETTIVIPDYTEQTAIAAFLDRETGKIDELVAEQRRLMALLKEKRQAVISHAVTRGLNPAAPLKPSGIEWLGDLPKHWRVGKVGFYLTILSGFAFPSAGFSEDETKPKLLRGINVGVSRLKWDETVYWERTPDDGLDMYEMKAGDLVIGMDRPLIAEGIRVAKVNESDLPCLLLQRVASLKAGNQLNADYLLALLSSEMFVAHFAPETTGVSVPHISPEQIYNFVVPVPSIKEQDAIAAFLESETAKFDTLTAEAQRAIDLLQERRTALISAAVTGQIDVRPLLPKEAA